MYLGAASTIAIVFRRLCEKSLNAVGHTQMAAKKNAASTVRNIELCSR
jgi:hypothetical protein